LFKIITTIYNKILHRLLFGLKIFHLDFPLDGQARVPILLEESLPHHGFGVMMVLGDIGTIIKEVQLLQELVQQLHQMDF
jgi:hypothetical protein